MENTNCAEMECVGGWGDMFSLAQCVYELRKGQRLDTFHLPVSEWGQLLFQRFKSGEEGALGKCWMYNEVMFLLVSWSASREKRKEITHRLKFTLILCVGSLNRKQMASPHLRERGIHVFTVESLKCSLASELVTLSCWCRLSFHSVIYRVCHLQSLSSSSLAVCLLTGFYATVDLVLGAAGLS